VIYAALFFAAFMLYFSEGENKTIRENAKLEPGETESKGPPKKKKTQKEIQEALKEYIPNYALDTQQRKDAEIFFRTGVRELQNKNFRRAFTAFETALTVDPTHELAKIYLKSAKMEMLSELESITGAALRAKKALRYKESRMHYDNVLRYLEGEAGNNQFMDNESNKKIKKMFDDAQAAIKELDKEENKIP
jgi:tetratricopeptide (TPR) repeat protein